MAELMVMDDRPVHCEVFQCEEFAIVQDTFPESLLCSWHFDEELEIEQADLHREWD